MERPYVICHMLMALDGKIDGRFFSAPETMPALGKYGELRRFYDCPVTIYGTTTMAEGYADGFVSDLPETDVTFPNEAYLPGVSDRYLAYLRGFGISYLFAGKETIDCEVLLRKLKTLFGIDRALLAGGGVTNWSFAANGLVDELSVVLAPAADGDSGAASLFETGGFSAAAPAAFSLKSVEQIENDTLWLRYTAKNRRTA